MEDGPGVANRNLQLLAARRKFATAELTGCTKGQDASAHHMPWHPNVTCVTPRIECRPNLTEHHAPQNVCPEMRVLNLKWALHLMNVRLEKCVSYNVCPESCVLLEMCVLKCRGFRVGTGMECAS